MAFSPIWSPSFTDSPSSNGVHRVLSLVLFPFVPHPSLLFIPVQMLMTSRPSLHPAWLWCVSVWLFQVAQTQHAKQFIILPAKPLTSRLSSRSCLKAVLSTQANKLSSRFLSVRHLNGRRREGRRLKSVGTIPQITHYPPVPLAAAAFIPPLDHAWAIAVISLHSVYLQSIFHSASYLHKTDLVMFFPTLVAFQWFPIAQRDHICCAGPSALALPSSFLMLNNTQAVEDCLPQSAIFHTYLLPQASTW